MRFKEIGMPLFAVPSAVRRRRRPWSEAAVTTAAAALALCLVALGPVRTGDAAAPPAPAADAPAAEDLEPGVSFRVWDVERALDRVHEPAPGQTPNFDVRREVIDYPARGDFGGFGDRFIVEVSGWLRVDEPGVHIFRLTSDDGSLLTIGGERVVWNRGLHAPIPMDGTVELEPGLHRLRILMFEHEGGEFLSLAWQPPSAPDMAIVPASHLRTERGVTRVTSPGTKRLQDEIEGLRAGDGLELDAPHPGWRVEPLHPESWDPMVGCLARLDDGRLIVGTFEPKNNGVRLEEPNGTLWILSNLDAADPDDIVVERFADGFYHPLGMALVDGQLFVAERDGIARLWDADGDGSFESRERFAGGWESDNYHHFTFGLEHRGDFLYATLSTSIGAQEQEILSGEIRGINGPNPPHRGTLVRIDLRDRSVSYVAGGFRTPNGLLALPDREEILVGDNQGAWMPANRINAVLPGRFYGHYNETRVKTDRYPAGGSPSLFSDRPISPPAVWLPHSEIASSPTDFVLLPSGPHAGQILVSDVKYGGLRRVWLEEVDGELQGGVTRHSQGFEGGINRLLIQPDGSIIVGCIGEQATWSWRGTRTGLQRMVPTGETAFEYDRVEATADGLRVRFSAPVPIASLRSRAGWTIKQWRYVGGPEYGGPKLDEETLTVAMTRPAADRRSVELVIPGLKAGRCIYARRNLADDAGRSIHATEFWYTLNRIPGGAAETGLAAAGDRDVRNVGDDDRPLSLLVFTRTAGFRHASIPDSVAAMRSLGAAHGFTVVHTEDARIFSDESLAEFDVVMFLNTTGDVLDLSQEAAFERRMRAGGGFVGVHAASDTEYDWSWYGGLVGTYFRSHPAIQEATIEVVDREHPSTRHLGEIWVRTDEWYDFRAIPAPRVKRLLQLDETTYTGGRMGSDHPIAWYQVYDGARSFYTGGGHTSEAWAEPDFLQHVLGGIVWAAGPRFADLLADDPAAAPEPAPAPVPAPAAEPMAPVLPPPAEADGA
jgi:type 1 glutamine amidotransferase/glucose/arabinose dehydrogenase